MEIIFKLVEIRGDKIVLESENNGEQIIWSKNSAPLGLLKGDLLNFLISKGGSVENKDKKQAKDILNEILNVE
ncbi:hypothetical protein CVU82_00120 [Candidatus Falkowbacteria bacterium HGW-Falkowbacteria-1]|jgi:hypothetical protein|uniref:DUF3006 domain-containing protein n=1 Tax=Candidatus Falkowbacteria bacterium HGW-Falkowbacteria-1 TaxID=2013768 RepID=A0A2N2EA99_9BACT|nr:MAG: hypothetical protein CVU82_00120 [Candidatus Falkowbacteria bacterium HGW-Falkowbacteria-1]